MSVGKISKCTVLLSALILFVFGYGLLPAFASEGVAKAQKRKQAASVQQSSAGQAGAAVADFEAPSATAARAAGTPPLPRGAAARRAIDAGRGEASAGRVDPPGPVPSSKTGVIGAVRAKTGVIGDSGAKTGVIGDTAAKTGIIGDTASGAGTPGAFGSPPLPGSENEQPPRPRDPSPRLP